MKKFSEQARQSEQSANNLDDVFSRMNMSSLAAVAGVTALVGVLGKIKSSMLGAVNIYAGFEKIEVGLAGVMKNLGNTKKQSDEFLKSLKVLSNETTFGYDTLADAAQQMLTVGVSTNEVKTRLIELGNAAGGSTQKFNDLAQVYTKILTTGKAGAMQLQQLSRITGVSWVNALGKSSASAREVTEQMQKMTSEGGVLAGAMDRLIDTIEGKQGFVSDWFSEMTRNFVEASGIASVYKGVLDFLSDTLEGLAGIFERINENPFSKAILTGAVATALTALVTIIGVAMVGAIKKVNAQLAITATLKAIINPASAAIALGISAIVGATVGFALALKDVKEKAKEAKDEINGIIKPSSDPKKYFDQTIYQLEKEIESKKKELKLLQKHGKYQENGETLYYRNAMDWAEKNGVSALFHSLEEIQKMYNDFLETQRESNGTTEDAIKLKEQELAKVKELYETYKAFTNNIDTADKLYEDLFPDEKKLAELKETIKTLNTLKEQNSLLHQNEIFSDEKYNEVEKKLSKTLDKVLKQERELQIKIGVSNGDWRAIYEQVTGTKAYGTGKSGAELAKETEKKLYDTLNKQIDLINHLYGEGTDESKGKINSLYSDAATKVEQMITSLLDSKKFSFDDNSINALVNLADALNKKSKENNFKFDTSSDLLSNFTSAIESGMQESIKEGGGIGKVFEGMKNGMNSFTSSMSVGTIVMMIFVKLMQASIDRLQQMDTTGLAMNPFETWVKNFDTAFNHIVKGAEEFNSALNDFFGIFAEILETTKPAFGIFRVIIKLLSTVVSYIGKFISALIDGMYKLGNFMSFGLWDALAGLEYSSENLADAQEEEAERLRRLNDEYSRLYEAMKEQEEYYLTQKMLLNSQTYNDSITKVNDMILTPRGTFSTSPQDTILAMKHPENLMQNKAMTVTVNNYTDSVVNTEQDSYGNLVVAISRKIANDANNGDNGWSDAMQGYNYRQSGKRVSI